MASQTLISVVESPAHPDFSALYRRLNLQQLKLNSMRKAISQLKSQPADFIVAEFFYGYGNNYAGVNISNLDVLLSSLNRYAPNARVLVLVDKAEHQYVAKLEDIFPLHAVLVQPVREADIERALTRPTAV